VKFIRHTGQTIAITITITITITIAIIRIPTVVDFEYSGFH